jgi:hypothetical protein|tara:strand:- start:220 stop:396 length:177 start_codon:yes stop_codon:yes gene_type:complete
MLVVSSIKNYVTKPMHKFLLEVLIITAVFIGINITIKTTLEATELYAPVYIGTMAEPL